MKARWAFFVSLLLGLVAFSLEFEAVGQSMKARTLLTQAFIRHQDPSNATAEAFREANDPSAEALLHRSEVVSHISVPFAALSGLGLLISRRRKEPAWRWTVWLLLLLYGYLLGGPI